ncbi:MAG: DegV family protein [Chloroflexi bacterium]|nr:MAG: DegV family protein [Chloroflexota bacterium]
MSVAVLTDSCASIPRPLVEELQIEVVPYYIHIGERTLRDLVDVHPDGFFQWLPTADELPKTANPGPGDYLAAFKSLRERTNQVVTIHMTSWGSGAYQAALVAKEMAEKEIPGLEIRVVDTKQVAMAHGWAVIEAARAAQEGASIEEVVRVAEEVSAKGMMIQTADTLRYLYMGGRIGRAKHLLGSVLSIKPLIGMEDGVIVALGQARSRQNAYQKMIKLMEKKAGKGAAIKAAITHVAAPEEASKLQAMVEEAFDCREMLIAELSPALGVHTGPGTVGVCFYPLS